MAAPRQMTSELLNGLKGWPRPDAVDFAAKLDAAAVLNAGRVPAGSVCRLNSSGNLLTGLGNNVAMPLFTVQASDDPDVANDGGNAATVAGVFVAIAPTGVINTLVAVGAYELSSTNFDTQVSYNPNDLLTSPATLSGGVSPGTLTKTGATLGTATICGIVSRGQADNGYGFQCITFWPIFIPAGV